MTLIVPFDHYHQQFQISALPNQHIIVLLSLQEMVVSKSRGTNLTSNGDENPIQRCREQMGGEVKFESNSPGSSKGTNLILKKCSGTFGENLPNVSWTLRMKWCCWNGLIISPFTSPLSKTPIKMMPIDRKANISVKPKWSLYYPGAAFIYSAKNVWHIHYMLKNISHASDSCYTMKASREFSVGSLLALLIEPMSFLARVIFCCLKGPFRLNFLLM